MSTVAVIPPPNSTSLLRHLPRLTSRARTLLTAVNLHYAGVTALGVLCLYLAAHTLFVLQALHSSNADALAAQRQTLRSSQIAALPLRGLDDKLGKSTGEADEFYGDRLPYAGSQVASELGNLAKKQNVRLSRAQYAYSPALSGSGSLTEARLDASLSGDYRPLVEFINSLERDKMFFVINGITFTGAQTGAVNLRMRLTTYLRQPKDADPMADTPAAEAADAAAAGAVTPGTAAPVTATPRTGAAR